MSPTLQSASRCLLQMSAAPLQRISLVPCQLHHPHAQPGTGDVVSTLPRTGVSESASMKGKHLAPPVALIGTFEQSAGEMPEGNWESIFIALQLVLRGGCQEPSARVVGCGSPGLKTSWLPRQAGRKHQVLQAVMGGRLKGLLQSEPRAPSVPLT